MRILNRYLLVEILVPFLLGLSVFTIILLVARILKLVELVVNRGVPLFDVLRIFSYILPAFLEVTVPMAVLLAVLVAFGRLSSDSEVVALTASGISLWQLLVPVMLFAIFAWSLALLVSLYGRPWGNAHLREALYDIAKTRVAAGIKEKVFTDDFEGLVIYVDQVSGQGSTLRGILISDSRDASQRNTILSRVGYVVPNETAHTLTLRLLDGSLHNFYDHNGSYHRTDFNTYDIILDLSATLAKLRPRDRDPNELTVGELNTEIARKTAHGDTSLPERIELHRKFSIPFASIIFALAGVPLGIRPTRAVRSRGFAISLVLIFAYYLLLTLGESLGLRGLVPPMLALWLPNLFFMPVALLLFLNSAAGGGFVTSASPIARLTRRLAVIRPGEGS